MSNKSSEVKSNDMVDSVSKKSERSHRYSAERNRRSSTNCTKPCESAHCETVVNADTTSSAKDHQVGEQTLKSDANADEQKGEEKSGGDEEDTKDGDEKKSQEEEELKFVLEAQAAATEKVRLKKELREKNLAAHSHRPEEAFFRKLDSSMKKNTSFVKKLRTLTEQQRESLINEFNGLNLSKYIQEVVGYQKIYFEMLQVTAIVEAKFKVADVNCAAYMCSMLHQRYTEFTPLLKKTLLKNFENINCKDDEKFLYQENDQSRWQKAGNVSKFRTSLLLVSELVLNGVMSNITEGVNLLQGVISTVVSCDKGGHVYAPVILSIVRHSGEDLADTLPRKPRLWKERFNVEFPRLEIIPKETQMTFRNIFKDYYESMAKHLVRDHKDLQNRERQNRQTIGLKGELPQDRREAFEKAQKSFEKLLTSTTSLAEMLDEEVPDLPEEQLEERDDTGTINVFTPSRGAEYDAETGLWEDEDTKTFYENVKDLKSVVPQILLKEKETKTPKDNKDKVKKKRKLRMDLNLNDDFMDDFSDEDLDENYEEEILGEDVDDNEQSNASGISVAVMLENYLKNLPNCVNRDLIDQAAEDFVMKLNTKGNRKKLVRALFTVNRTRLDLLPFYGRLVATLSPCLPEIAQDLVYLLKGDFRFHVRKKDQINVESKIKTVRFIGELTKFKICPKAEALHCLKMLLENFTHHNIEMACNLLETCGRFLFRSPESHPRMASLLEQMMRKKTVQAFDSRQATMIENAFYYCNPPDRQKIQKKVRPPMHEYIRKLLYKDLSKTTTEKVLRQMRKLPWDDPEEDASVAIVDGVLEHIRLGMELNISRYNQRRVSGIKYLGELYNYQLVENEVVFTVLYALLTFGNAGEGFPDLDPPDHLFRIRLVCILLDTCGQYFDRGTTKKKLDCYLTYFQCYIWRKKESGFWNESCPFPREVDYMVADTLELLRPKISMYSSSEEAYKALAELEDHYQSKIERIMEEKEETSPEQTNPVSVVDPSQVPLPASELSGASLCESQYSASPSIHSQSSDADEDAEDSEYASGDDEDLRDDDESMMQYNDEGEMFSMDADEDNVRLKEAPKLVKCAEDDHFVSAFDKMMSDSFQGRLSEAMKTSVVDIAIPMHLKGKGKKKPLDEKPENVNFVLMLRKGNKQQFKDLNIPVSTDLAANIRDKQLAERAEHEEMKRLVLDYNQRQEEEEMMGSGPPWRHGSHAYSKGGHRRGIQRLRSRDHDPSFFGSSNWRR